MPNSNDDECRAAKMECSIMCTDLYESGDGKKGGAGEHIFGGSIAQCIRNCLPEACGGEGKWKGYK
jgi:hypothetical protein